MSIYNRAEASATATASSGLGLSTLGVITGIVLCILKGCGVLSISWFWATFPFWIIPAIYLALFVVVFIIGIIVGVLE